MSSILQQAFEPALHPIQPATPHLFGGGGGTLAAGSGELITGKGKNRTTTPVTTPIVLGNGNHHLVDNETNAVITGGDGNNIIAEAGTGASITLGNGNNAITDKGGTATIVTGNGDQAIDLGGTGNSVTIGNTAGGKWDVTAIDVGAGSGTVVAGNGNMAISAGGANNTITVGKGNDVITLNPAPLPLPWGTTSAVIPVTSDIVNLGSGANLVFIGGSGNTINAGGGTDTIAEGPGINNTVVLGATGGSEIIAAFSPTKGDTLDLTKVLAGVTLTPDLSNLGSYVSIASKSLGHHGNVTDTVLTITGSGGSDTVTLLNAGTVTLASLISGNSLILPAH